MLTRVHQVEQIPESLHIFPQKFHVVFVIPHKLKTETVGRVQRTSVWEKWETAIPFSTNPGIRRTNCACSVTRFFFFLARHLFSRDLWEKERTFPLTTGVSSPSEVCFQFLSVCTGWRSLLWRWCAMLCLNWLLCNCKLFLRF